MAIETKRQSDKDALEAMGQERVKCGEYVPQFDAYPILYARDAGPSLGWKTRAYCPSIYRPMIRLLNCRIAWTILALEPKPALNEFKISKGSKGSNKRSQDAETIEDEMMSIAEPDPQYKRVLYALYRDGLLRNLFYATKVRHEFFAWLDKTYYKNKKGTGKLPASKPLLPKRCDVLETWMQIELLSNSHDRDSVLSWVLDRDKVKKWNSVNDVFDLGKMHFNFQ